MISQTAEYALRAVACLGSRGDLPMPGAFLSEHAKIPADYVPRVMQQLNDAGIVRTKRGPGGGYLLAIPASELTALQVVNAIAPVSRIDHCPLGIPGHETLCPLHAKLDEAYAELQRVLASTVIADILPNESLTLQCGFPLPSDRTEPRETQS